MLVLLSFALVLVATVLLVLGLLSDDGLLLIYLSIGSSVLAAVVLLVALRVNRPRHEAASGMPAPLPDAEPELQREPALVGATAGTADDTAVAPVASPAAASGGTEWQAVDQDAWAGDEDWDGEVDFPIADYDTLTTGQILPLLPQLYADEIDVVEERERATKGRAEILTKLAQLRTASEAGREDPLASYTEPADDAPAPTPADDPWFPIEDYESLSAAQIRPLLRELDGEELAMVRSRELSLGRRQTLLDEIDHLSSGAGVSERELEGASSPDLATHASASAAPSRPAAARGASSRQAATRTAAAKAAPAKKAAAKKAPAKKATATKRAAPAAKKATAATKATATKKATTKKAAPAKKATSTKATPAKKAAGAKKASPAKKATATKKATTKKATATKKAAKKATGR